MGINYEEIYFENVLYYMNTFTVFAGSESFNIPSDKIYELEINKYFERFIYPFFYVSVEVPMWFYGKIMENKKDLSVSMILQHRLLPQSQSDDYLKIEGYSTELSGKYTAVIADITAISDYDTQKAVDANTEADGETYGYNEIAIVEFLLYNTAFRELSFSTKNAVLTKSNLMDALTYCLGGTGITNILVESPTNTTSYSEFKLLPITRIKNILRILDDYEFYDNGAVAFFDLDRGYLLNKKSGCRVYVDNEYKVTRFECGESVDHSLGISGGVFVDNKNKTNVILYDNSSLKVLNNDQSPLLESMDNGTIMIDVSDVIFSMLTPNKEIVLSGSGGNKKYNGSYRLYGYTSKFIRVGSVFRTTTRVLLIADA